MASPTGVTNRRLKIAMVASCPFPANHGTPGAIRELSLFLAKQGHDVHIITYPQSEPGLNVDGLTIHRVSDKWVKDDKITIGPSKSRVFYDFLLIPLILKVIKEQEIDIIHCHNYEATMAGWPAKLITRRPLVYNGINSMADELPTYESLKPKWFFRRFGQLLDFFVPRFGNASMVLSDELKHYLVDDMKITDKKIFVIPPGVDPSVFEAGDGNKVYEALGVPKSTPIVLYTGAIEGFQRVDLLVESMQQVINDVPTAKLLIACNIANTTAKADLLALAEQFGISDNLIIHENVSFTHLPDYLDAADVAVSPRVTCPGYPIKLLNYMAAKKAIVCFSSSAKAICHGYNGYVAADENAKDLGIGISLLLRHPDFAHTVGQNAYSTIQGTFDWDAIAMGTVEIYRQLIAQGKVDTSKLKEIVKRSYTPSFVTTESDSDSFLKEGELVFPTYE